MYHIDISITTMYYLKTMEISQDDFHRLKPRQRRTLLIEDILRKLYAENPNGNIASFTLFTKEQDINSLSMTHAHLRKLIKIHHEKEPQDYLQDKCLANPELAQINLAFGVKIDIPAELFALLLLEGFTRKEMFDYVLSHNSFMNLPGELYDKIVDKENSSWMIRLKRVLRQDFLEAKSQRARDDFFARQFVRSFMMARFNLHHSSKKLIERFVKSNMLPENCHLHNYPEFYCINLKVVSKKHLVSLMTDLSYIARNPESGTGIWQRNRYFFSTDFKEAIQRVGGR